VAVALDDEALAPVALDCQSRTTGGTPASVRLWERCAPKRWGRVNVMGEVGVWNARWSLPHRPLGSVDSALVPGHRPAKVCGPWATVD